MTGRRETIGSVDLGGSHVVAGRVELASASVTTRRRLALAPGGTREQLLGAILGAVRTVATPAMTRWGVSAPGPFDYGRGICTIHGVGKLEALYGVDLRAALAGAIALDDAAAVRFLNDAEAFLLGEWAFGAARGHQRAVGITLGTGLGSAFLADGRIVVTGAGVPPEGSLHLVPYQGGCVEDVISARGLRARYGDRSPEPASLAARARRGDAQAREAFATVGAALVTHIRPWLGDFGATCLVVGGSIAGSWDLLEPALAPPLRNLPTLRAVVRAERLEDASLLGAALHAADGG